MRARCSRVDTYRAAPTARSPSIPLSTGGTAIPHTVIVSARTKRSSSAEKPAARRRRTRWTRLLLRALGDLRRANAQLLLQLQEVLLAEAADVHDVLDLLERAVLLPVLDDAGGGLRTDAGQRLELRCRRCVDVDDARGGGFGGVAARCLRLRRGRGRVH